MNNTECFPRTEIRILGVFDRIAIAKRISVQRNNELVCNTDLGPARMEIAGDAPEIGTHVRPRLPLVLAAAATVADANLDRAGRTRNGALNDRAL